MLKIFGELLGVGTVGKHDYWQLYKPYITGLRAKRAVKLELNGPIGIVRLARLRRKPSSKLPKNSVKLYVSGSDSKVNQRV